MTWVDLAVLGVLVISALLAFMRGLVREVLGLAAWVGAIFCGVWALPRVQPHLRDWLGASPWIDPLAFAIVFVVSLIVFMLISRWVSALVRASPVGGLDRTLGLVFGLARGAVLLVLAYVLADRVMPVNRWPEPVLNARLIGPVYQGAKWVVEQLPQEFRPGELHAPPTGPATTSAELLQATPQGRAVSR